MQKYISRLHYLTQDLPERSHLDQVITACEAGANWIQYRCFSKPEAQLLEEVNAIAEICDDWGTTLIVTDHISLLAKADIQGVHIEDMAADFSSIRKEIGEDKTLGASANSLADVRRIAAMGVVDYIGCGPFAFTLTKPNDYPMLGKEGYEKLKADLDDLGIAIPLIAVGGITANDIEQIVSTGVYGVAVSGAINKAENPAAAFKEIYRKLY